MKKTFVSFIIMLVSAVSVCLAADKDCVKEMTDANAMQILANPSRPFVIDFSATWCGPCRMFAPTFHKVAGMYEGKVDFFKVDVDKSPELSQALRVQSVPTIFLVNPKTEKSQVIQGAVSEEEFLRVLKSIL